MQKATSTVSICIMACRSDRFSRRARIAHSRKTRVGGGGGAAMRTGYTSRAGPVVLKAVPRRVSYSCETPLLPLHGTEQHQRTPLTRLVAPGGLAPQALDFIHA